MTRKVLTLLGVALLILTCGPSIQKNMIKVTDADELKVAIKNATPGTEIVLANGVWKDAQIKFNAHGTEKQPIILKAETPGRVTLEGQSSLHIGGKYLVVDGLYFKNGYTPSSSVIKFKIDDDNIANHCQVTNIVIDEYVQPNRFTKDHWVEFYGQHNSLDHSYLAGKFNEGPTVRVFLNGNQHIRNYHQITNNHFGPKPRKGGPRAETMQIGDSYTSMTPSYVSVTGNYFERCNGEVEIISSKSNFNEFKDNVFFECEGSLVMRHGNYCLVDGNFFIGDEKSQFNGGIRVINTGHWITNNYFYMLKGDEFRSPLAVMNGIPKSPLNRYNQVTDVVVAHNTWIDCETPWQFSVGANANKKDVLPASEIRSARPIRTILANNIIHNNESDPLPIKTYDEVKGIKFKNNILSNQNSDAAPYKGIDTKALKMEKLSDWLYVPATASQAHLEKSYSGFGFEDIQQDVFDYSRSSVSWIGAITQTASIIKTSFDKKDYGATWFNPDKPVRKPEVLTVSTESGDLAKTISQAQAGDIIELTAGTHAFEFPLVIDKKLTLKSADAKEQAVLVYSGDQDTPALEMHPKANLLIENLTLEGKSKQYAFATLKENMSFGYNLWVEGSEIKGFRNILKAYKGSFADTISFSNTVLRDCANGIELAAETNDKGDYNAEFLNITNCEFYNVRSDVINFYRGGYDESTIGGNLLVEGCYFENCGKREKSKILIKTRGIINVNILNNTFSNNPVKLVALLWGEKNNLHSGNEIKRSGSIRVDKYLKQKLMY